MDHAPTLDGADLPPVLLMEMGFGDRCYREGRLPWARGPFATSWPVHVPSSSQGTHRPSHLLAVQSHCSVAAKFGHNSASGATSGKPPTQLVRAASLGANCQAVTGPADVAPCSAREGVPCMGRICCWGSCSGPVSALPAPEIERVPVSRVCWPVLFASVKLVHPI